MQSQYFLYEVASGETAGDTSMFDRGVGTFLEHARNRLTTDIASAEVRASRYALVGQLGMGLRCSWSVSDHLREWRWVDSAGFALPSAVLPMGDSGNVAVAPVLQGFARSDQDVRTSAAFAFVQREGVRYAKGVGREGCGGCARAAVQVLGGGGCEVCVFAACQCGL